MVLQNGSSGSRSPSYPIIGPQTLISQSRWLWTVIEYWPTYCQNVFKAQLLVCGHGNYSLYRTGAKEGEGTKENRRPSTDVSKERGGKQTGACVFQRTPTVISTILTGQCPSLISFLRVFFLNNKVIALCFMEIHFPSFPAEKPSLLGKHVSFVVARNALLLLGKRAGQSCLPLSLDVGFSRGRMHLHTGGMLSSSELAAHSSLLLMHSEQSGCHWFAFTESV